MNDGWQNSDDDPNWQNLDVESRASSGTGERYTGLGDPTRWGASDQVVVSAYDVDVRMGQLIRVQADDPYPRNWQMLGTLTINEEMFTSPAADYGWLAYLDVTMGTGQTMVQHRINMRALLDLAVTPGLYSTNSSWYAPIADGVTAVCPWILPGGLTARTIAVQMGFRAPSGDSQITLPVTVGAAALVSPFAVGHKL